MNFGKATALLFIQLFVVTSAICRHVKLRVKCIEVFAVQIVLNDSEAFAKSLIVYDFAGAKEANRVSNFRVFYETKNIVIGSASFLFRCHVFVQVCNRVTF